MAPVFNIDEDDFYGILKVKLTATRFEIRASFKALALRWHPDRNRTSRAATQIFQKINRAYAILSDDKERRTYDRDIYPVVLARQAKKRRDEERAKRKPATSGRAPGRNGANQTQKKQKDARKEEPVPNLQKREPRPYRNPPQKPQAQQNHPEQDKNQKRKNDEAQSDSGREQGPNKKQKADNQQKQNDPFEDQCARYKSIISQLRTLHCNLKTAVSAANRTRFELKMLFYELPINVPVGDETQVNFHVLYARNAVARDQVLYQNIARRETLLQKMKEQEAVECACRQSYCKFIYDNSSFLQMHEAEIAAKKKMNK